MAELFISSGLNPNILKTPNLPLSVEKEILEIHQERKGKAKKFLKNFQGRVMNRLSGGGPEICFERGFHLYHISFH